MNWAEFFAKLCPRKPTDTCPEELATCRTDLKSADIQIANLANQLAALQPLQQQYDELMATAELLKHGPTPPDMTKVRWLPQAYIDQVMTAQLGTKYSQCSAKHFSESDYLVCSKEEMRRFIDYYAFFWMPNIKYVTQQWKKLDGSQVEIWMNDCDNYSDFFKGIPAINANWACFPWGQIWAQVQGIAMAGGHAFSTLICCDENYKETSIAGLKAYLLEPQMAGGGPWPATRPQVTGYELKELKEVGGFFEIVGTMWMVKL